MRETKGTRHQRSR